MSEGLTAVYRFETKVSTNDGSQPGGRLAYAGVSGGFGTITLGQIWNAAYNHVGSITDGSWHYGDAYTGYRHGNAVSFATSAGPVSMQLDAILDGKMNTDSAVDKIEFGMTVDLGDIGKVALAHTNIKDTMVPDITEAVMFKAATFGVDRDDNDMTPLEMVTLMNVTVAANDEDNVTEGMVNTTGDDLVVRAVDGSLSIPGCDMNEGTDDDDGTAGNGCTTASVYVWQGSADNAVAAGGGTLTTITTIDYYAAEEVDVLTPEVAAADEKIGSKVGVAGKKKNHIAVQLALGPVTGYLGHSTVEENGASAKDKITHYGLSGGLGDSGFSFHAMGRSEKMADGMKKTPWLVGVTKGLGGGATAYVEHGNDDSRTSGKAATRLGLKVDF